jgi:curved DNA-binding protein CbpA
MNQQSDKNRYYAVLGIKPDATQAEIKDAYRRLAPTVHPDRGGSQAKMAALNEAYDCLSDTPRRLLYDMTGEDVNQQYDGEVRSILMAEFASALDEDVTDILYAVRSTLKHKLADILQKRAETEVARVGFEVRRNRIKTKTNSVNLFHLVIDRQLSVISAGLALLARQEKLLRSALEELDSYVSEEKVPRWTAPSNTCITYVISPDA